MFPRTIGIARMTTVRCIGVITIALLANGSARAVSLAHVADSIGAHACSVSTPSVAEVWTRALTDIHAGHGPLALDLLDSLRSSGAQLPESFDFDFAALSAYCYLPGMAEGQGSGP